MSSSVGLSIWIIEKEPANLKFRSLVNNVEDEILIFHKLSFFHIFCQKKKFHTKSRALIREHIAACSTLKVESTQLVVYSLNRFKYTCTTS